MSSAPAAKVIPFPAGERLSGIPNAEAAVAAAQDHLLGLQRPDGHWEGELTVDSTLCSDTVLYLHWSGRRDAELERKCADHVRRRQLADGGWNIYVDGPSEINASVKAYFALKLSGDLPSDPWMREARAAILRLGGIPHMNTYAKLYLALLGQFPWRHLPTVPVELFLLPKWLFLSVHDMSSWTRGILAPLAILNHFRPTRELPAEFQLHELFPAGLEGTDLSLKKGRRFFSWRNFFLNCDKALKAYDAVRPKAVRERALKLAERWMVDRMGEGSEGLGAIFPAMLNGMMALRALGYAEDHPLVRKADADFAGLFVDDAVTGDFRIQPCLSPVWDTAITTIALGESGVAVDHPSMVRAAAWLEEKEVRFRRGLDGEESRVSRRAAGRSSTTTSITRTRTTR